MKWYVPETLYNETTVPPFVNGAAYAMSKMAVHQILSQCAKRTPINIEDLYLTLICREKAGVEAVFNFRFCISLRKVEYIPERCATFHSSSKRFWSYMSHKSTKGIPFDYTYNNG